MACNIIGSMASLLLPLPVQAEVEAGELLFDGEAVTLREAAEDPPLFFDYGFCQKKKEIQGKFFKLKVGFFSSK